MFPFTYLFAEDLQIAAVTESGKKVILSSSGTWEYAPIIPFSDFDFRNTRWGMTREEVHTIETAKFINTDDDYYIAFKEDLTKTDEAQLLYFFANNLLVRTKYYLGNYTSDYQYSDYHDYIKLLTKKYGEPIYDKEIGEIGRDENFDEAFQDKKVYLQGKWDDGRTEIKCTMERTEYTNIIDIQYRSLDLMQLEKDKLEQEVLQKL